MNKPLPYHSGGPQPPSGDSMWSIFQNGIDHNPDWAALVSVQQPPDHLANLVGPGPVQSPAMRGPDEILTWSYAQVRRGAARLATVMARHQIPPESVILTFIPQSAEWILLVWASALARLAVANRAPGGVRPPPNDSTQARSYISSLQPSVIVVEDEAAAQVVDDARLNQDPTRPFLGLTLAPLSTPRPGWLSLPSIASLPFTESESTVDPSAIHDRPDRPAQLFFTSGSSTGTPKGVFRTVRNLCASAVSTGRTADLPPGRAFVATVPGGPNIVISTGTTMLGTAWYGGTLVIPGPNFGWADLLQAVETCRASVMVLLRSHISLLAGHRAYEVGKVKSLRRVFVGGEIMPRGVLDAARGLFPEAVVFPSFGMTEGSGMFGWPEGIPDVIPDFKGVLSVGMAMPGVRVRIVKEDGAVAGTGEQGELHLGGEVMFEGYWGDHSGEGHFYEDEAGRWFDSGDIAVLDEGGCVYVVGRAKDRVTNIAGQYHPFEIQTCVSTQFGVETEVVGIQTPMRGTVPVVILEQFPNGITEADVREHCLSALSCPHILGGVLSLEQLGMMEGWPRTGSGKVSKRELQDATFQFLETQVVTAYSVGSA